ncbi:RNA recognition domain-containing protein [Phlyctema vagabunda]|uniref:RNA recognition domain-containing protein n=1 Tax=Phlyctema vagabunda TaxID=108571 RepID=A0ABR4PA60_9HELO
MSPNTPFHEKGVKSYPDFSDTSMSSMATERSGSAPISEPSPLSTYGNTDKAFAITSGDDESDDSSQDGGVYIGKMGGLTLSSNDHDRVFANTSTPAPAKDAFNKSLGRGSSSDTDRYVSPFVRAGLSRRDDPFKASSSSGSTISDKKSLMMSKGWRSGASASSTDGAVGHLKSAGGGRAFSILSHDDGETTASTKSDFPSFQVTGKNAQAIYSPGQCIFVANLSQQKKDAQLEAGVIQIFRQYGTVFVKVRRDGSNMPFAFCQYTTQEDAERALQDGRGRMLFGRDIRTERAKAHRVYFMDCSYGILTIEKALDKLKPFGKVDQCFIASIAERKSLGIEEKGVIVHFELYENGIDAQTHFRHHDRYRLRSVATLSASTTRVDRSDLQAQAYIDSYERDRRTIHIASLPVGVSEAELGEHCGNFGRVSSVTVVNNPSKIPGHGRYVWGFVEFATFESAQNARHEMNETCWKGNILRVSERNSGLQVRSSQGPSHSTPSRTTTARAAENIPQIQLDKKEEAHAVPSQQTATQASQPLNQGHMTSVPSHVQALAAYVQSNQPLASSYTHFWEYQQYQWYWERAYAHFMAHMYSQPYGSYAPASGQPAVADSVTQGSTPLQSSQDNYHAVQPTYTLYNQQPSNAYPGQGLGAAIEADEDGSHTPTVTEHFHATQ